MDDLLTLGCLYSFVQAGLKLLPSGRVLRPVEFLDLVFPHLIVKRNQALVVFAWDAIRPGYSGTDKQRMEYLETCQLLIDQMHWLNKRGDQLEAEPVELELAKVA